MALVPTARAPDNLNDGETITDVTKGLKNENDKTRWISLFPTEDIPIKIPEQDEVLYLTETVENLKKHPDVKRFLTISFEKEIFAYAERAYKYVQSLIAGNVKQQRDQSETINLEIRSLLVRKLPEHGISAFRTSDDKPMHHNKFQFPSSRNIKEELQDKSLQGCGVQGFCNTADGFLLLVAEPKEHTDRKKIASRIKKCLSRYLDDQSEILWVESIKTSNLTARGDKLTNPETKKKGTLGCFGRRNGTGLVAITAGHFVKTEQRIQIENSREFGTCAESHELENVDIAIIDVNENESSRCVESFQNENGEVCEASVYRGDELQNWPVHKIGAETKATSGVVYSGDAKVCREEGIVICGNTDHPVFARHGDSGAIVFFYDPHDINHKSVKLLSIVSRDIDIKPKGTIPVSLSREPVLTRSLKDGLDLVHDITI
ncbi:uncharacterized protein LOC117318510 [Pecten maximus]|uniref:uncharacterized protein LOC117318510 n=1 Tax=Pecten maximus TaxID=6579 RepID=UPI0014580113|nr:uncharacterized protein LOC117318510 [Pecten maximus]